MKPLTVIFLIAMTAAAAGVARAEGDRITLKSGKVHSGSILFTDGAEYAMTTASGVVRVRVADIERIDFGAAAPDGRAKKIGLEIEKKSRDLERALI